MWRLSLLSRIFAQQQRQHHRLRPRFCLSMPATLTFHACSDSPSFPSSRSPVSPISRTELPSSCGFAQRWFNSLGGEVREGLKNDALLVAQKLALLPSHGLTTENMATVVERLTHLHGPDAREMRVDREVWLLFRCLIRYPSWQLVNLPEGLLSFAAPGSNAGRVLPLLTSPCGPSYDVLSRHNPGITLKSIDGRDVISPKLLGFGRSKQTDGQSLEDADGRIVAITLDPTEQGQLVYDEGLFPALFEAAIAVRVEDCVSGIVAPVTEPAQALKMLFDISEDAVWFAHTQIQVADSKERKAFYSVCMTALEPGLVKSTVRALLTTAAAAEQPIQWRYVCHGDGTPCVWPAAFVKLAAAKLASVSEPSK